MLLSNIPFNCLDYIMGRYLQSIRNFKKCRNCRHSFPAFYLTIVRAVKPSKAAYYFLRLPCFFTISSNDIPH